MNMDKINKKISGVILVGCLFALIFPALKIFAKDETFPWDTTSTPRLELPTTSIELAVKRITNVIFYLTALIALIMVTWGGVTLATAAGDPQKVDLARRIIMYALIAIVVSSVSWGLVSMISTYVSNITTSNTK